MSSLENMKMKGFWAVLSALFVIFLFYLMGKSMGADVIRYIEALAG